MLKAGKLDSELLKKIVFDKITFRRPEQLEQHKPDSRVA